MISPSLASLILTSPLWGLALLGAVGGPLLAHLLSRRGGTPVRFPATRFVSAALGEASRWAKVRRWFLLALRAAVLGLVVLAFMRPAWSTAEPGGEHPGQTVAIVLDRSASMQRVENGMRLFDEAKRQALAMLEELRPHDRAVVVLADEQPDALLPKATGNLAALRERLLAVQGSQERGRLDAAAALAARLGRAEADDPQGRAGVRGVRMEVFSDLQQTNWRGLAGGDVAWRVRRVGQVSGNVALAEPGVQPGVAVVGRSADVSVMVHNFDEAPRRVTVTMRMGGDEVQREVRLAGYESRRVGFRVTPGEVGMTLVSFGISANEGGALDSDDQAWLWLKVIDARPVTVVTRADVDDPSAAAYHIIRALQPTDDPAASGVGVRVLRTESFPAEPANDAPMVYVFAEAGSLEGRQLWAVREQLNRGGGVLVLADSAEAIKALDELSGSRFGGVSPWISRGDGLARGGVGLSVGEFDHALLAPFEGPSRAALLAARFGAAARGAASPAAETVLTYDNGEPALVVRWAGGARFAVWAGALDPGSTRFVKEPAFVAMLHQLVLQLSPSEATRVDARPGEAVPAVGAERVVTGPGGDAISQMSGGVWAQPGPYRVMDAASGAVVDGFAVMIDPAESDLRQAEVLEPEFAPIETAASVGQPAGDAGSYPLWPVCLLGAVLLLAVEGVMSGAAGALPWKGVSRE